MNLVQISSVPLEHRNNFWFCYAPVALHVPAVPGLIGLDHAVMCGAQMAWESGLLDAYLKSMRDHVVRSQCPEAKKQMFRMLTDLTHKRDKALRRIRDRSTRFSTCQLNL